MRRTLPTLATLSALALGAAALPPAHADAAPAARPRPSAQPSVNAVIDRAVEAWGKVRTLRATVEQQMTNPLTGSVMTSRGHVQQRRPDRLAVRFTDPAGDVIVSDGETLWLYLPSSVPGQVIKTKVGGAGSLDLTEQFLSSPKTKYTITDDGAGTVDGRGARVLRLAPKEGQQLGFLRAKVWVDDKDALIRQFEVTDANGLARKVKLSDVKTNVDVEASAFKFTPPKGARIVER